MACESCLTEVAEIKKRNPHRQFLKCSVCGQVFVPDGKGGFREFQPPASSQEGEPEASCLS